MTEQRIFPFIVNGQFWKEVEVSEQVVKKGCLCVTVMTEIDAHLSEANYPNAMAKMKNVRFQLAEIAEDKGPFRANWFVCFWLVDDDLYIDNERLYLRH